LFDRSRKRGNDLAMLQNHRFDQSRPLAPGAHFGNIKSVHIMGSLIVAESHYSPFFETPRHWHETASFTMVFGGCYHEDFDKQQFECKIGSALYRPAGEVHRDRISKFGAHCLMVEMPNDWVQQVAARGLTLSVPAQSANRGDFPARIRRELALADALSAVVVEALVVELACTMERDSFPERQIPLWLRQLRERMDAEFAVLPRLDILARDLGVHPGHMARAFRRHFGCTIGEYARSKKIAFCCAQLRAENSSLCEIAAMAGFSSQAHLTRSFKLHTGMTPGEFRRMRTA
jgi:AraC family transcriptional regulator